MKFGLKHEMKEVVNVSKDDKIFYITTTDKSVIEAKKVRNGITTKALSITSTYSLMLAG